jgi:large subunit ribosomal protein L24e
MALCSFCGKTIIKGTGKIYVKTDGKILNFCSRKCEKNLLKLKRKPRTTGWTEEYHKVKKGMKA